MKTPTDPTTSAQPAPATGVPALVAWRCFHCDEHFTDETQAQLHFGARECQRPACHMHRQMPQEPSERVLNALEDVSESTFCGTVEGGSRKLYRALYQALAEEPQGAESSTSIRKFLIDVDGNYVADASKMIGQEAWIPVTERLPALPHDVLVWIQYSPTNGLADLASFWYVDRDDIAGKVWQQDGKPFGDLYPITHWMTIAAPQPAAPEGGGNG